MAWKSNCLFYALELWVLSGFRGHIGVLEWGNPWPHFAVLRGDHAYHFWAHDPDLPWYKQFWFLGSGTRDYTGSDDEPMESS